MAMRTVRPLSVTSAKRTASVPRRPLSWMVLQGVLALVGHAVADHRLRHAAGGAEDLRRAGAHAEGQVRGLPLQLWKRMPDSLII